MVGNAVGIYETGRRRDVVNTRARRERLVVAAQLGSRAYAARSGNWDRVNRRKRSGRERYNVEEMENESWTGSP